MEHEKSVEELGRFARRLAENIRTLIGAVPFGAQVYWSRHDPERLARPVVAVVGARGVGKSTLLEALDAFQARESVGAAPATDPASARVTAEPPAATRSWEWR